MCLFAIRPSMIDHDRARGLTSSSTVTSSAPTVEGQIHSPFDEEHHRPSDNQDPESRRESTTSTHQDRSASTATKEHEPTPYLSILQDRNILVLLTTVFLFHFGNAAMLPLLSQMLAISNGRAGIPFTAACIMISQGVMVPTAFWVGGNVERLGSKRIFVLGEMDCTPLPIQTRVWWISLHTNVDLLPI